MIAKPPPPDFNALRSMTRPQLHAIGCGGWDGKLMLFPASWFDAIPDGFVVYSILDRFKPFTKSMSRDQRFGFLSFGIVAQP